MVRTQIRRGSAFFSRCKWRVGRSNRASVSCFWHLRHIFSSAMRLSHRQFLIPKRWLEVSNLIITEDGHCFDFRSKRWCYRQVALCCVWISLMRFWRNICVCIFYLTRQFHDALDPLVRSLFQFQPRSLKVMLQKIYEEWRFEVSYNEKNGFENTAIRASHRGLGDAQWVASATS